VGNPIVSLFDQCGRGYSTYHQVATTLWRYVPVPISEHSDEKASYRTTR